MADGEYLVWYRRRLALALEAWQAGDFGSYADLLHLKPDDAAGLLRELSDLLPPKRFDNPARVKG